MSELSSLWWTDERIEATFSREYVLSHLKAEYHQRLFSLPPWGEGLTSETYLEWILTKAAKLFLILSDIGIAERIFTLVDLSFDDTDLPIAETRLSQLRLAYEENPALNAKFFHAQWRFLVRGIKEGEHVRFTENEGVPIEVQRGGITHNSSNKDGMEKVVLSGAVCRLYLRTQIKINEAPHFFEEAEVLDEIQSLRKLAHEHVFSVYGSYFVDDSIYVLFAGTYERTLISFLTDAPQHFKKLSKPERRNTLVNWPHCLASALAWLHANGHAHGAIRPSNILVDFDNRIFLGQFEAHDTLLFPPKINDVEAYQYAAPERWIRTAAAHDVGPSQTMHHSGGRTARRPSSSSKPKALDLRASWISESSRSDSAASKGTVIRVGSPNSPSRRTSHAASSSSSGSSHGGGRRLSLRRRPILYTPSITSSNSSDSTTRAVGTGQKLGSPLSSPIVHTWQSHQANAQLSDIFSLGAVTLDIFTYLCERKLSAFANHRAAKNRAPGRGGAVADASFHLDKNLLQVTSWITLLEQDSKKRKGLAFRAVKPMLEKVREMLGKHPESRPSAADVERQFANIARQLDGIIELHCLAKVYRPVEKKSSSKDAILEEPEPVKQVDDLEETKIGATDVEPDFDFGINKWGESTYAESSDETDRDDYDPDIVVLQDQLRKHWDNSSFLDSSVSLGGYAE
jgi:serine/threonine protein kinase